MYEEFKELNTFHSRIYFFCEQYNISIHALEKALNWGNGTIAKAKIETISYKRLKEMADFFNTTVAFLAECEGYPIKSLSPENYSEEEIAVIHAYRNATATARLDAYVLLKTNPDELQ